MNEPASSLAHGEIRGEGFPLVILHAMGTDHQSMQAWIEPVFQRRPGWQRIYLDIPAHGRSPIPDGVTTSAGMLTILLHTLDAIIPDRRFAMAAKSFGGYLAQGIFHHREARIDGLCLVTSPPHRREHPLPPQIILERDEGLLAELDPDIAQAFETLFIVQNRANLEHFLHEIQPGRTRADRAFLTSGWRAQGYSFPFEPFAPEATYAQPALFLLGRQDAICGYRDQAAAAEHFPKGTLAVVDRAGHMVEIEQRTVVQALFSEWLDRVELYRAGQP